ncbi:serine/threonine-protein kinase [Paraliomyxa miuraensis]|uniref:serine/threonine-protein kinase n=1 Tax=Paraliomyxa miuraensis TaxID=376150 RepID=UPI0022595A3E|nr:serine/threonine-protein kinase [Paraliomyxa miuraensis]MCX4243709.1 serine/threonine protein kinase [Paraliomyxa miuraensis]
MSRPLSMQASLGTYRVVRKLGQGGMADVFHVRRQVAGASAWAQDQEVALKRIRPELASNREYTEMLLEEARLGAALHHPNLVEAYDVGYHDEQLFFTMELVRGSELRHIVREAGRIEGRLQPSHAIGIVLGVAAGLHYAHELTTRGGHPLRIVHLDVCPSNVLVNDEGYVKLIDFGIAKTDRSAFLRLLADGSWVGPIPQEVDDKLRRGTMAYMSPEQCLGTPLDRRSDVFSLGVILWELTVWSRLYRAPTQAEVFDRIVGQDAPTPRSIDPTYPVALESIVMRALARDPVARFQTALELQEALEDFAFAEGLHASAPRLAQLMRKLFPKKPEIERDEHVDALARRYQSIGSRWSGGRR